MTAPAKYWQRADLGELANGLRDEDTTSLFVLGVLNRLLDEVDRLNQEVADLWGERR